MMLWKKQKEIEKAIEEYLLETEKCLDVFGRAFEVYFVEGFSDNFKQQIDTTHRHESKADDQRREIEYAMYDRALIPESRGDIMRILESLDLVPNKCESVLYQIWGQNMSIPGQYTEQLKKLVQVNQQSYALLCQAVRHLFGDIGQVLPAVDQVLDKESESDRIERELIKSFFDASGDKSDKILLKEVVLEIGAISDRAENAADCVRIVAVKQQT